MLRWSAALLSLPLPGLGHALAGAPRRALWIAAVALAAQALMALIQATDPVTPILLHLAVLWMVMAFAATLVAGADAWRLALRARPLRDRGGWRRLSLGLAAVLALNTGLAFLPISPTTWRSFYIPSSSMFPTLRTGDRFIVQAGWYDANPVRRGDIVVFSRTGDGADYVKRVIGIGGDRVRMVNGTLLLNGTPVPSTRHATEPNRNILTLPNGPSYSVTKLSNQGLANNTPEFLVPPGHLFVLGDNLDNSDDSRTDARLRYVPTANLIGRAAIIYWPFANGRAFTPVR